MLLVLLAPILALIQVGLWQDVTDDAYVSLRYVERLLDGRGLTFNHGDRVEGFSHPVWLSVIALAGHGVGGDLPEVARVLGVVCALMTLIGVLCTPDVSRKRAVIALLLVFPGTHIYASSGLETPLLGFVLALGTLAGYSRRWRVAAIVFGVAAITRPEGLLYGTFWLIFTLTDRVRARGWKAREAVLIGLVLAPSVAYQIFRVWYFDAWLPNTFWAKPPGTFGGLFGLDYLLQAFVGAGGIIVLGVMAFVRVDVDRRLWRHAAGPILAAVVFVLYAWREWMPFSRFLTPVWPLVSLLVADWVVGAARALAGQGRFRFLGERGWAAVLVGLIALSSLGAYGQDLVRYATNDGLAANLMRGHDQLAVGEWLAASFPPGTTVVTSRLGGMSYAAPGLTFWDERGLTDREQAMWIARGRPGGDAASPVYRRRPDVVAALEVPADWSYTKNAFLTEHLEADYRMVKAFPQGNFGEVHIWVRERP